jgi:hypothetical protein
MSLRLLCAAGLAAAALAGFAGPGEAQTFCIGGQRLGNGACATNGLANSLRTRTIILAQQKISYTAPPLPANLDQLYYDRAIRDYIRVENAIPQTRFASEPPFPMFQPIIGHNNGSLPPTTFVPPPTTLPPGSTSLIGISVPSTTTTP